MKAKGAHEWLLLQKQILTNHLSELFRKSASFRRIRRACTEIFNIFYGETKKPFELADESCSEDRGIINREMAKNGKMTANPFTAYCGEFWLVLYFYTERYAIFRAISSRRIYPS